MLCSCFTFAYFIKITGLPSGKNDLKGGVHDQFLSRKLVFLITLIVDKLGILRRKIIGSTIYNLECTMHVDDLHFYC